MASEQLEIERLLSDIADDGATPERTTRLQELLLNRPDLQGYYARVVALHTLLKYEFDLTAQQFAPLLDDHRSSERADGSRGGAPKSRSRKIRLTMLLALAAGVMAVLAGGYWLNSAGEFPPSGRTIAAEEPVAAKMETLAVLRSVTQTAVSEVTLPARAALNSGLTLCSGAVWITRSAGQLERGYMVELPPGAAINVAVDADAGTQNALAVIELDAAGAPTGNVMFFRNDKNLSEDRILVGGDAIANWSQRNNGLTPKYYLFTSIHKPQKSRDDRWRLSDYAVLLNTANVTYLGWDDSGYTSAANPTSEDYFVDKDYDDISAIIQIRDARAAAESSDSILFAPQRLTGVAAEPSAASAANAFTVRPGHAALIRISGRAGWQNAVEIVDRKSSEVLWRHQRTAKTPLTPEVYLIRNSSAEVQEYYVRAMHKEAVVSGAEMPWLPSDSKILRDQSPSLVLGFEDGGEQGVEDYDDVIVHIREILNATQPSSDQFL